MEEAANAEMWNLGYSPAILYLGKLNWIVDEEEEDPVKVSELRRQIGEVRGTKIVAAMAIDLTSTVPTTFTIFQVLSQGKAMLLVVICERLLIVPLTLVLFVQWVGCGVGFARSLGFFFW